MAKSYSAWRTQLVPRPLPLALRLSRLRQLLFQTISQTGIDYADSALSQSPASGLTGGMRLPWAPGLRYDALRRPGWHLLHVGPAPAAQVWAQDHHLPATEVAPAPGEAPGTSYLVRPDGYVGLLAPTFPEAAFDRYAQQWGLSS